MSNILTNPPSLTLVTSSPYSGKLWLIQHVLDYFNQQKLAPAILSFNIQAMPSCNVDIFVARFNENMQSWYKMCFDMYTIMSLLK